MEFDAIGNGPHRAKVVEFDFMQGLGVVELCVDEKTILGSSIKVPFHSIVITDDSRNVELDQTVYVCLTTGLFGRIEVRTLVKA